MYNVDNLERTTPATAINNDSPTINPSPLENELRTKVLHKALYVLRKRQARIDRRQQKSTSNVVLVTDPDTITITTTNTNTTCSIDRNDEKNRNNNLTACDDVDVDTNDDNGYFKEIDSGVFCHWLLRQCSWEVHFFLRACGFYLDPTLCGYETPNDVKQVGGKEWEDITLPIFEQILRAEKDTSTSNDDRGQSIISSWIHVQDGKASLRQSFSDKNYQRQSDDEYNNNGGGGGGDDDNKKIEDIFRSSLIVGGDESEREKVCDENENEDQNHDNKVDAATLSLIRHIDQTLTEIVCRKDGGHQVGLQLILHRYPHFKELLGGRDLWKLYSDYSNISVCNYDNDNNHTDGDGDGDGDSRAKKQRTFFFQAITMFYNGTNLILRSKRPKTYDGETSNDCNNKGSCEEKRMKVDEEGLYSVTNKKWGRAMSNLVIQASHQTNLFDERVSSTQADDHEQGQRSEGVEVESPSTTNTTKMVIDLTASVGGMTLELAKSNFFDRVLALEIDEGRAALCRENLSRHGFSDKYSTITSSSRSIVEIRHQDSVHQIPFLPRRSCFVIDPPWGGYDYKQKVRRQQVEGGHLLKLGDTPLEDVLGMISHHNAPCVAGLRLPINFVVQDLLNALGEKERNIKFECLTIRKISVQLFVILYFPSTETP